MVVVIATAGGSEGLDATLESLEQCSKPPAYSKTVVVENGGTANAKPIVERYKSALSCEYLQVEPANKSHALNECISLLADNQLIFFSDDDIKFDCDLLLEMADAAERQQCCKSIFGGSLRVSSDGRPEAYLKKHLPASMIGFPKPGQSFDSAKDLFLGANWAAYSDDIKSVGGFDPRFGPGSPFRATGQESEIMKKFRSAGYEFVLVESAIVWHTVEPERFCEQFVESRKYRSGVQIGLHAKINQKRFGLQRLLALHLKKIVNPVAAEIADLMFARKLGARLRFSGAFAKGVLNGYGADLGHPELERLNSKIAER